MTKKEDDRPSSNEGQKEKKSKRNKDKGDSSDQATENTTVASQPKQDAQEENVKVAVRVRPFNKREIERKSKLIVDMQGTQTILKNDKDGNKNHTFAFDYSYWSHDGCKARADGYWEQDSSHPNGKRYCDQKRVFDDLGVGILKNAWDGYNSTLFAYGQTGSGKSYSVVGWNANKGIVPLFCEKLFNGIEEKKKISKSSATFEVTFSMLEIYNEVVRDLLNAKCDKKKGLKLREHPKKGFYAENLTQCPVDSYQTIETKMNEGTTNRTIAATNMNETSSRAHTIVCITFVQKRKNESGQEMAKTSVNNLVDLAGSERVTSTGATGDKLKEGAAINQSLSALGNCISALADQSQGKKVKVPYRDSTLTKLLMNALGGNSKTIMIAAVSPAAVNFEESLSSLRYADRAKQIKTKAYINEDPTEKLIRELQEENARLQAMLKSGGVLGDGQLPSGLSQDEEAKLRKQIEEEYKAQVQENERQMEEMRKTFEEKLLQSQQSENATLSQSRADILRRKQKYPYFYNLNSDIQLNGMITHIIKPGGKYTIGNQKGGAKSDIVLRGPSISEQHALITCSKDMSSVILEKGDDKAKILVNGVPLSAPLPLHHFDRVLFGTTQIFVFANPVEAKSITVAYPEITWETAQEEIAQHSGFDMQRDSKSENDVLLQQQLVEVMPAIEQANAISEALDKMVKFEMIMVRPEVLGKPCGPLEIYIRWRNFINGLQYDWSLDKFMSRFYRMQEVYEDFEEDGNQGPLSEDADPFVEPLDIPVKIGAASVYLKSVAYRIPFKSQVEIVDIRGTEIGLLNVELNPCNGNGKEINDQSDTWLDHPDNLLGNNLQFAFKLVNALGLPPRFCDIQCKYKVFKDQDYVTTRTMDHDNPNFNHTKILTYKPVTQELLNYLMDGNILVEIWALQMPIKPRLLRGSTRDMMASENLAKSNVSAVNNNQKVLDLGALKIIMDSAVLRQRQEKLEQKLQSLRDMIRLSEERQVNSLPLDVVKSVIEAPSADTLKRLTAKYTELKGTMTTSANKSLNRVAANVNNTIRSATTKSTACVIS